MYTMRIDGFGLKGEKLLGYHRPGIKKKIKRKKKTKLHKCYWCECKISIYRHE